MDVHAFQESRKAQLDDFMAEYGKLKTQYNAAISAAISQRDTSAQKTQIQTVLDTNAALSELVKNIIGALTAGTSEIDTATLDQLTADLIKYQKDYEELQNSTDQVKTLKMIQATTSSDLQNALTMYNWYLIALCFLCLVVIMLAIRAAWTTSIFTSIKQTITAAGQ